MKRIMTDEFSKSLVIVLIAVSVMLAYFIYTKRITLETFTGQEILNTGTIVQSGYFTVSSIPGDIVFNEGEAAEKSVTIIIQPLDGFNERVEFEVGDVLGSNGISIEDGIITAEFASNTISGDAYDRGVVLNAASSPRIAKGRYVITYKVISSSVIKNFIAPVIVQ